MTRFHWESGRKDVPDAVRRELEFHLEESTREFLAQGMSREDAHAAALRALGDRTAIESELHTLRNDTVRTRERRTWFNDLSQDIRVAWRGLVRAPAFTFAAVATIALGIGANSAVFTVARSVLLRPLPYPEPSQLVQLWTDVHARSGRTAPEWLNPADFAEWREQNRTFSSMAAYRNWGADLTGAGDPITLTGLAVTGDFFKVLGVPAALGRTLNPDDDRESAERVVVITSALWQRAFGGDRSVLNSLITLNGDPWRVVGIMPATFRAPLPFQPEVYRAPRLPANSGCGRGCIVLRAIGRLKSGVSIGAAQSDIAAIAQREAQQYPAQDRGVTSLLVPLHAQITGPTRTPLIGLGVAVALVLLISCVNVANLMLLRGAAREREFGVRAALGARRGRIVRQLLTESGAIALAGGTIGLVVGAFGSRALGVVIPHGIRDVQSLAMDATTVAFTAVISILAALIFGLLPSFRTARRDMMVTLKTRATSLTARGGTIQQRLIVVQLVLAVVLVAGTGLLIRSLVALERVDLGFRPSGVMLEPVAFPQSRYQGDQVAAAATALLERVRGRPGVRAAEITDVAPLVAGDQDMDLLPVGESKLEGHAADIWYRVTSPGYLPLMQVRLIGGRYFNAGDRAGSQPVVIVNDVTAKELWGSVDPVGRVLATGAGDDAVRYTVVGVVAASHQDGPNAPLKKEAFFPLGQLQTNGFTLAIEPTNRAADAMTSIRAAAHDLDPLLPIVDATPIESVVADVLAAPRLFSTILGAFALAALLLAAVGVYGVTGYAIAQRRRDIGVRLARGASPTAIRRALLWKELRIALLAAAIGLALAAAGAQFARALLFGVQPADPVTFAAAALVLLGATLAATWIPVRRATRIDPANVLRDD